MPEATDVKREAVNSSDGREAVKRLWPWFAVALAVVAVSVSAGVLVSRGSREAMSPQEALASMRRNAREREISKMIETLREIDVATVLIKEGDDDRGASVTLKMRRGTVLGPETASAVAGLVASAVPGLHPASIVVVDSNRPGETHRLAPDADVAHEGAALLRLRAQVERALADKIRGFFAGMQIESVVVVSAQLDLDRVKERMLQLDPEGSGEIIISEERSSGSPVAAARSRGKAAGLNRPAELPSAATAPTADIRKTEAMVSWVTREVARSAKGLADVSASVVVFDRLVQTLSGGWEYDRSVEKHLDEYRTLVAHALGIVDVKEMADKIAVRYLRSPWANPPVAASVTGNDDLNTPIVGGAILASALIVLAGVVVTRRRTRIDRVAAVAPVEGSEVEEETLSRTETLRREAMKLVTEDIDRAAAVLGQWVAREV